MPSSVIKDDRLKDSIIVASMNGEESTSATQPVCQDIMFIEQGGTKNEDSISGHLNISDVEISILEDEKRTNAIQVQFSEIKLHPQNVKCQTPKADFEVSSNSAVICPSLCFSASGKTLAQKNDCESLVDLNFTPGPMLGSMEVIRSRQKTPAVLALSEQENTASLIPVEHVKADKTHQSLYPQLSHLQTSCRAFTKEQLRLWEPGSWLENVDHHLLQFMALAHQEGHELYELLMNYWRCRKQLCQAQAELQATSSDCKSAQNRLWTFRDEQLTLQGVCADQAKVCGYHRFQKVLLNESVVLEIKKLFETKAELLHQTLALHSYTVVLSRLQIESFLYRLLNSIPPARKVAIKDYTAESPDMESQSCLLQPLKESISVLFCFTRRVLDDCQFQADIHLWLQKLIKVLNNSSGVYHFMQALAILMSPVKNRDDFMCYMKPTKLKNESASSFGKESGNWTLVDEGGEEDEDPETSWMLLAEDDLITLFCQFPFDQLFKHLLGIGSKGTYKPKATSSQKMMKIFAFASNLVELLAVGLTTYNRARYRQFVKRIGHMIRMTLCYVSDHWAQYVNGVDICKTMLEVQSFSMEKLQVEFDELFLKAVLHVLKAKRLGIWLFMSEMPYGTLSSEMLWKIFYIMQCTENDNLERLSTNLNPCDCIHRLKDPEEQSKFQCCLSEMNSSDGICLLTTFAHMAQPKRTSADPEFVRTIVLQIYEVCYVSLSTRETFSKVGKELLAAIAIAHPHIISVLLEQVSKTIEKVGMVSLYLFKDLPLYLWTPAASEIALIRQWLLDYNLSAVENKLACIILEGLNWGVNEQTGDLVLDPLLHSEVALLVVEAYQKFLTDKPYSGIISESIKQVSYLASVVQLSQNPETSFNQWAWDLVLRLKLHSNDRWPQNVWSPIPSISAVPEIAEAPSFHPLLKAVKARIPIGCYLALNMTSLGHRFLSTIHLFLHIDSGTQGMTQQVTHKVTQHLTKASFGENIKYLNSVIQNALGYHGDRGIFSSVINWIWAGNVTPSFIEGSSLSAEVWFSWIVLNMESIFEEDSQLRHCMEQELLANPCITPDHALKKAQSRLKLPIVPSLSRLMIYRWAYQALATPADHPLLPLIWQRFFQLYLRQPGPEFGLEAKGCIGRRYFHSSAHLNLLKDMRHRLTEVADFHHAASKALKVHRDLEHSDEERNLETPTREHMTSPQLHEELVRLFQVFSIWLGDDNLQRQEVYLPSLPKQYDAHRLAKVMQKQLSLLLILVAQERILTNLKKHDCSQPPLPLVPMKAPVQSISISMMSDEKALRKLVHQNLTMLQQQAKLATLWEFQQVALDSELLDTLPQLYSNREEQLSVQLECHGSGGRSCQGPAIVNAKFEGMHKHEAVQNQIQSLKRDIKLLQADATKPPPQSVAEAAVHVENLITTLVNTYKLQYTALLQKVGISAFYQVVSFVCDDTQRHPPTRQFFSFCIEMLGQVFIRDTSFECKKMLATILCSRHLCNLLSPYFTPNACPADFVSLYDEVVQALCSDSNDVIFMLLTKIKETIEWLSDFLLNLRLSNADFRSFSLFSKWGPYMEEVKTFWFYLIKQLIEITFTDVSKEPVGSSLILQTIRALHNKIVGLFQPWILVLDTGDANNPRCYPWMETDSAVAASMVTMFTELIDMLHEKFKDKLLPGQQGTMWLHLMHYCETCTASKMPEYILYTYHKIYSKLQWKDLHPDQALMEQFFKVERGSPKSCFLFLGTVLCEVNWVSVLRDALNPHPYPDSQLMVVYLLYLMTFLAKEDELISKPESPLLSLLGQSTSIPWNYVDIASFQNILGYVNSHYPPAIIIKKDSSSELTVKLLKMAAGFDAGEKIPHQHMTLKCQAFLHLVVEFLCALDQSGSISLVALDKEMESLLENMILFNPPETDLQQRHMAICGLFSEILKLLNTASISTSEALQNSLRKWVERKARSPLVMPLLTAACRSLASVQHMAHITEACIFAYFTDATCHDQYSGWGSILVSLQVPELTAEEFLKQCLTLGSYLTLYVYILQLLNLEQTLTCEKRCLILLRTWMEEVFPSNASDESKLFLWWHKALELVLIQAEQPDVCGLRHLLQTLLALQTRLSLLGEERLASGILGAIGLGRKSPLSSRFRVVARSMSTFLLVQVPSEERLRLQPGTDLQLTPKAQQALDVLESMPSNKQYADFQQSISHATQFIRHPGHCLQDGTRLLALLINSLYPDIYYLNIIR
ncbi:EPG5 protein, partial [Polypterus senegalus]